LGGAVNMVTPTAYTLDHNAMIRTEGGSFGTSRIHAQAGRVFGGYDVFAAATKTRSGGYRRQSDQDTARFNGNIGIALGRGAETRFYATWNDIAQELPSSLSKF